MSSVQHPLPEGMTNEVPSNKVVPTAPSEQAVESSLPSSHGRGEPVRGEPVRGGPRNHGGRFQSRGNQHGRVSHHGRTAQQQQQGRGSYGRGPFQRQTAVMIAPTSGVPYGHVPAYLPGSSSLVEELDERLLIVLRDGRHLVGVST